MQTPHRAGRLGGRSAGDAAHAGGRTRRSTRRANAPTASRAAPPRLGAPRRAPYLGGVATLAPDADRASINHDTVQPVVDVQARSRARPRRRRRATSSAIIDDARSCRKGVKRHVRGQSESMTQLVQRASALGLLVAIVLVYLLLVVLFQSWLDPFIIMLAVPGALVGILWMLALTGTTLNVESFMGAIMAVGIAVSNSILLVNFANEARAEDETLSAVEAALDAGATRLRPVLMTALAMILGMLPMALGLGEGGEQNAPLGRAVIGGLLVATLVTLFVVPLVYTRCAASRRPRTQLDQRFAAEARGASAAAIGTPPPDDPPSRQSRRHHERAHRRHRTNDPRRDAAAAAAGPAPLPAPRRDPGRGDRNRALRRPADRPRPAAAPARGRSAPHPARSTAGRASSWPPCARRPARAP